MPNNKVGLFFGSFNPIHNGHLMLADYLLSFTDLEQVWFVVTPHNPFKQKSNLLPDRERLHLAHLALEGDDRMRAVDIEFHLPQPNYTAQSLAHLREQFPEKQFVIIMGEDNLRGLHKWKNVESIVAEHDILAYPRHLDVPSDRPSLLERYPRATLVNAPRVEVSATLIRESFRLRKPLRHFLPKAVFDYIEGSNLFQ